MKKGKTQRKTKRVFELGLKLDLVKQLERGEIRVSEVCRIYGVSHTAVYKWLKKHSEHYARNTQVIVERKSLSKKNKEQLARIKELERALGQKQMRIDYLEKVLDFASAELGESIEKKTKQPW